jgi:type I restriction enzyme R subunit
MAGIEIELEFSGKKITFTEYKIITRKFIEKRVPTIEKLQELWVDDSKRRKFIDMLQEMQMDISFIKETEKTEESDTFDVMANMVFESPLITRKERAEQYLKENIDKISCNDEEIKNIIIDVMDKYEIGGIENINLRILLNEDMIQKEAYNILKDKMGAENVVNLFNEIKKGLYRINIS